FPTLAELAGAEAPKNLDGISFVPALLGKPQKEHEFLYWEMGRGPGLNQAVRMGDWKAIRHKQKGPVELYNLSSDLSEKKNVASDHPEIVEKITNLMASQH